MAEIVFNFYPVFGMLILLSYHSYLLVQFKRVAKSTKAKVLDVKNATAFNIYKVSLPEMDNKKATIVSSHFTIYGPGREIRVLVNPQLIQKYPNGRTLWIGPYVAKMPGLNVYLSLFYGLIMGFVIGLLLGIIVFTWPTN